MKAWTMVYTLLAGALISGCMTTGKEVTQEQLVDFKRGETTVDDVIAKFGRPTSSSYTASGQRTLSYFFVHSQARPASFIPIVGRLAGGSDSRTSHVFFIFGPDGKLQEYRATESNFGTGRGFAAGTYQQDPNPDQPKEATR